MVGLHALIAEGLGSIPGWETMIPKATQHTRKVKTKTKQKKTKYILYGSIYKFPPTHPYISFEIRCNESMVANSHCVYPWRGCQEGTQGDFLEWSLLHVSESVTPLEDEPLQCDLGPADLGHEFISQYRQVVTAVPQTHA